MNSTDSLANLSSFLGAQIGYSARRWWARQGLRLVKSGPELSDEDVVEHPYNVLGGASLRKKATLP